MLTGLHKADSLEALAQALGPDGLAKEEAQTIHGLRSQFRCCLATLGNGAAAQAGAYDNLWGSFIIWVGARGWPCTGAAPHRGAGRHQGWPAIRAGPPSGLGPSCLLMRTGLQRAPPLLAPCS